MMHQTEKNCFYACLKTLLDFFSLLFAFVTIHFSQVVDKYHRKKELHTKALALTAFTN